MLDVHRLLRHRVPDLLLVLVPRHPERSMRVAALCAARGMPAVRRSTGQSIGPETQVLLGDTMGELPLYYAMSDAAFIGGSLVPVGGHNPVEAAAQGLPTVMGPQTFKITDTLQLLLTACAMIQVKDADELGNALMHLLRHPELSQQRGKRAQNLVTAGSGATAEVVTQISACLNPLSSMESEFACRRAHPGKC